MDDEAIANIRLEILRMMMENGIASGFASEFKWVSVRKRVHLTAQCVR